MRLLRQDKHIILKNKLESINLFIFKQKTSLKMIKLSCFPKIKKHLIIKQRKLPLNCAKNSE